jgi:hypothetical protein
MDRCNSDGVCQKNPFMHGAVRPDIVEESVSAICPHPPGEIPPEESTPNAKVPEYDPARTRSVDMNRNSERLSDQVLDSHLEVIHPQLMECLDLGACYSEEPLFGARFDFELRVAGSGAVTEASVTTTPRLHAVVACARRSVADVRFPKFKGSMTVTYSVAIE